MATAWLRPLSLPEEGRYVGVAWEMLASGNWVVPTLDTLPYFHKPPLFYWMTAAGLAALGLNEWAARIASMLAATGSAFALFVSVRQWGTERSAQTLLIVVATTPFFYGAAQFANLDMLVAACIGCTILCAADAVLKAGNGAPYRLSMAGAYLFAALGILAKGLIGVVIPGLVIVAWLFFISRPAAVLRTHLASRAGSVRSRCGPLVFAHAGALSDVSRVLFCAPSLSALCDRGLQQSTPVLVLRAGFLGLTLPWSLFLLPQLGKYEDAGALRPEIRSLMWIWLGIVLIFFSIPKSKVIGYVLPAVPPLAVLVAYRLAGLERILNANRWTTRTAAVAVAVCAIVLVGAVVRERDNIDRVAAMMRPRLGTEDRVLALGHYPSACRSTCVFTTRLESLNGGMTRRG